MRKQIITSQSQAAPDLSNQTWLDLENLASVELTSEDAQYPIEQALSLSANKGWRAATSGTQTLRILFNQPQTLKHIQLNFQEPATERTQEYLLRWSADEGKTYQDVVRQQWNFNAQSTTETENHHVQLNAVTTLELTITPDISNRQGTIASLQALRVV